MTQLGAQPYVHVNYLSVVRIVFEQVHRRVRVTHLRILIHYREDFIRKIPVQLPSILVKVTEVFILLRDIQKLSHEPEVGSLVLDKFSVHDACVVMVELQCLRDFSIEL